MSHLRTFLSAIHRGERTIVFEPRGSDWTDELVRTLATDLEFVHGVDPFLRSPVTTGLQYFRLHGRPDHTYSYSYTDEDFSALEKKMSGAEASWVLFNNRTMADDARTLQRRMEDASTEGRSN